MMDILMYLFEAYIHSDAEFQVDQDKLEDELLKAGFHRKDIYKALNWLEELSTLQKTDVHSALSTSATTAIRVYTDKECALMDVESRGFILFLEQIKVLTPETREIIIDRVMKVETNKFELRELKWIILMVLFNAPGNEGAYAVMEKWLCAKDRGITH